MRHVNYKMPLHLQTHKSCCILLHCTVVRIELICTEQHSIFLPRSSSYRQPTLYPSLLSPFRHNARIKAVPDTVTLPRTSCVGHWSNGTSAADASSVIVTNRWMLSHGNYTQQSVNVNSCCHKDDILNVFDLSLLATSRRF